MEAERAENAAMPQSTKERQEAFRARRALLDGATEVRGIFLPPELHQALKEAAKKLAAAHTAADAIRNQP